MSNFKLKLVYGRAGAAPEAARAIWEAIRQSEREDVESILDRFTDLVGFDWGSVGGELTSYEGNSSPDVWYVPDVPHVEIDFHRTPFDEPSSNRTDAHIEQALADVISFVKTAYKVGPQRPRIIYGISYPHGEQLGVNMPLPVTDTSLEENRIEYLPWLVVLPPEIVETYGHETLLSAPAHRVEELDDGAVLLVTHRNPLASHDTAAIDEYLGIDRPPEADKYDF